MSKLGYESLEQLSREMSSLARSNVPLPDGLRRLAQSFRGSHKRNLYEGISRTLSRGVRLSEALAGHGAPREFTAAVQCAEISGNLSSVLEFSIEHCRRIKRHFTAVATQLIYPALVIVVAMAVVLFLSHTAIPEFARIFARINAPVPPVTQFVFRVGDFVRTPWGTGIMLVVMAGLLAGALTSPFTRLAPRLLAWIPMFTPLLGVGDMAVVMRFLSVMLGRGVPLPIALRGIAPTVWVGAIRRGLIRMAERGERGHPVGNGFDGIASPVVAYLFRQAEARGDLADSCRGIAEYCEDRYEKWSNQILAALDPILIVMLGLIIGTIIVALYAPLFDLPRAHMR